jgi:hypothetical protein
MIHGIDSFCVRSNNEIMHLCQWGGPPASRHITDSLPKAVETNRQRLGERIGKP